jgi:hypothetical protein
MITRVAFIKGIAAIPVAFWNRVEVIPPTASGIKIVNIAADVPEFRREYTSQLDARALCTIEAKSWGSILGRHISGELKQPNGNRVWFEPDRIADKILDPTLVPLVQKFVDEVLAVDKKYIASNPSEFTDKAGDKWHRVGSA